MCALCHTTIYVGKTLQIIFFLQVLHIKYQINSPHIIIAPLSVINSWKTELSKFSNINVLVYKGNKDERQKEYKMWCKSMTTHNNSSSSRQIYVLLTSYEMVINDYSILQEIRNKCDIKWGYAIVSHNLMLLSHIQIIEYTNNYIYIYYYVSCMLFILYNTCRLMKHIG
jgi:hypothetical protein